MKRIKSLAVASLLFVLVAVSVISTAPSVQANSATSQDIFSSPDIPENEVEPLITERLWVGDGDGILWSDGLNWNAGSVTGTTDVLGFSSNLYDGDAELENDLTDLSLSALVFGGEGEFGYSLVGNALILSVGIYDENTGESVNAISTGITAAAPLTIETASNGYLVLDGPLNTAGNMITFTTNQTGMIGVNGAVSGGGSVVIDGTGLGVALLTSTKSYIQPDIALRIGGKLSGAGRTGIIRAESGSRLAPYGCITTSSLRLGGTYYSQLRGTSSCGKDRLNVIGKVTIPSTGKLSISLKSGFKPAKNSSYEIISNDGTDKISGVFAGLPEGKTFKKSGYTFRITYKGGSGANDVVLKRL